jgi:hypothetical protein
MAQIILNLPDQQVPRLADAMGNKHNLGRPATLPEVKQDLTDYLIGVVHGYEKRHAEAQLPDPVPIDVTAP